MRSAIFRCLCGLSRGFALTALVGLVVSSLSGCGKSSHASGEDEFIRVMNLAKNLYDKGEPTNALAALQQARALNPTHPDVHLSLAAAALLANQPAPALQHAQETLKLDAQSAAGFYLSGCARMRLRQFEDALRDFQRAKDLDRTVNAVSFQLARAHQELGHFEDARKEFEELLTFEPEHPAANYNLGQVLLKLGRADEANKAMTDHQAMLGKRQGKPADISTLERCAYTVVRAPFKLDQPAANGVKVTFSDATAAAFGADAAKYHGPFGVIDPARRGENAVFVREGAESFRLLRNSAGAFKPHGNPLAALPGDQYSACLVGDLNNDKIEDVVMLGAAGVHAFRFTTNGDARDITGAAGLKNVTAVGGALADLDSSGKLDLLAVTPGSNAVRILRNLGSAYFKDITSTSGVPATFTGVSQLALDDWDNDDISDLFATRPGQPAALFLKQRGGKLALTNLPAPAGGMIAVGDLNNDLRNDFAVVTADAIEVVFQDLPEHVRIPNPDKSVTALNLVDYDNDGWLDLIAVGRGVHAWRNLGRAGFRDVTAALGLDKLGAAASPYFAAADFDNDGDIDFLLGNDAGLRLLRNDGGNANQLFKLTLDGNRSNASALGIRVQITTGGLRLIRTVRTLPVEIGVGPYKQLDSLTVRWFDLAPPILEVKVDPRAPVPLVELQLPTGSCPYLYAWDGSRFRFITDILGASPVGLPVAEGRYIDSDPDEYVWIGNDEVFRPCGGDYQLQITEELREVLYLDQARLVVAEHPAGTEVHPSNKLLPGKPFPRPELVALHNRLPLLNATRESGADVTDLLAETDQRLVSPAKLRAPQLRGLAEPSSVTLDFGALPAGRPLVLALTGWLRFGGGMANIGASHDPELPFPFPMLEVERDGRWQPLDVVVGAPCGKTKTILVDLAGKLPPGGRRLRLSAAFEIHWDRAALFERMPAGAARVREFAPSRTDLHWRGYSEFADRSWQFPLTPDYQRVSQRANWRILPAGWCTRYGAVDELIAKRDDALVLINGGDELTLAFPASQVPPAPAGFVRDFFLFASGWDKDSDFHVARGTTVDPLPFHGMDDQRYGQEERPGKDEAWMAKYNTRWVGPMTLSRAPAK